MIDPQHLQFSRYPGFDEYILVNLIDHNVVYKRGARHGTVHNAEFDVWQEYFCTAYEPPQEKDVLLLHCCSWSKPYDFSFIINPIKQVADHYPNVHRAILSNVGIVPYEYQMNETFCAYDFITMPGTDHASVLKTQEAALEVRLRNYLTAHRERYKAVVLYARPTNPGQAPLIYKVCKELGIPFTLTPSTEIFEKYRRRPYRQVEEFYIEPESLEHLDHTLRRVAAQD